MTYYNSHTCINFSKKINDALKEARKVIGEERNRKSPAITDHSYTDKFLLGEMAVKLAIAGIFDVLEALGLKEEDKKTVLEWRKQKRTVNLYFTNHFSCKLKRKQTVEYDEKTKIEITSSLFGKATSKVTKSVDEFFWTLTNNWKLTLYPGIDKEKEILISSNENGIHTIKTRTEETPYNNFHDNDTMKYELCLDWLLDSLVQEEDGTCNVNFKICRSNKDCKTPANNREIKEAREWYRKASNFFSLHRQFERLFQVQHIKNIPFQEIPYTTVVSMFGIQKPKKKNSKEEEEYFNNLDACNLQTEILNRLTNLISEKLDKVNSSIKNVIDTNLNKFKEEDKMFHLITQTEIQSLVYCIYLESLCDDTLNAINFIESMLQNQVIKAIGKIIQPEDFDIYMDFHYQQFFKKKYCPKEFCLSIRRPGHSPEGTISIENNDNGRVLKTIVRHSEAQYPMHFYLSASTSVSFLGDRYIHAAVIHDFIESKYATNCNNSLNYFTLYAKARQFSSFVLLIGNIESENVFKPTAASIIKNQDDLSIILETETIPTQKEFKDSIESLSDSQKEFCKSYRKLQLSSTLFGIVIIQIKPQLERVLNLPSDSLTKEIKLTHDLMKLFIEYQISPDLVSFDGAESSTIDNKISVVKTHVSSIMDMLEEEKESERKEFLKNKKLQEMDQLKQLKEFTERMQTFPNSTTVEYNRCPTVERKLGRKCARMAGPPPVPCKALAPQGVPPILYGAEPPQGVPPILNGAEPPQGGPPTRSFADIGVCETLDSSTHSRNEDTFSNDSQITKKNLNQHEHQGFHNNDDLILINKEEDYMQIPNELEKRLEKFDNESAVRPTIIRCSDDPWYKKEKIGLTQPIYSHKIENEGKREEKQKAFDLLDALTRSGLLTCEDAELHIILANTHCFGNSLMNGIVNGENPIDKVEKTALILTSTLHKEIPKNLIETRQASLMKENLQDLLCDDPFEK